jgi:hypothetical protein
MNRFPVALFLRSDVEPANDRELLEAAIRFANEDPAAGDHFVPWKASGKELEAVERWRGAGGTVERDKMPSYGPLASERRNQWREYLSEYLDSPDTLLRRWVAKDYSGLPDVVIRPTWTAMQGRHLTVVRTYELQPLSWPALLGYLELLLLDKEQGLGAALCRCKLESCGQFFLEKKNARGGRPRRDYHDDKCMLEVHARESTLRAQKSRKARKSK